MYVNPYTIETAVDEEHALLFGSCVNAFLFGRKTGQISTQIVEPNLKRVLAKISISP
jgi:hypothetical protein